ncbi:radical SAM protein [Campylobacter lari]|nr:radical SAM protein [Campylobacter lari]
MIGKSLTFVPNSYCNFACSYCYLGKLTEQKEKTSDMAEQFKKIAKKLKDDGVIITEVFLHGAEFSTCSLKDSEDLLSAIDDYFKENKHYIKLFEKEKTINHLVHLKTNLYNLDKFYELFKKYQVGISASVDLPLRMHGKYRVLKNGKSTLEKTLKMIELLSTYPYFKQISATMTSEHLNVDEFIKDIYMLEGLGFDMANDFYIMFAYQSANANKEFAMASDEAMLNFYKGLREKLKDTKYAFALEHFWFKEFLGGYCNNSINCSNHLLIQKNGDSFICHRSQALKELKSGNILNQSFKEIEFNAYKNIQLLENSLELSKDCLECDYFHYCKASCVIERKDTGLKKSYTCALQKEIYKNNPDFFKVDKQKARMEIDAFLRVNQIYKHLDKRLPTLSFEMYERKNSLENIIARDEILKQVYDKSNFYLSINDKLLELDLELDDICSLKKLNKNDEIKLFIKKDAFFINSKEAIDNFVWMALIGGDKQRYGEEQRLKIPHIATEYVYWNKLTQEAKELEGYFIYDISYFLRANVKNYKKDERNFIFFTTKAMREYHYEKHAKNAFYHIQAINLPFLRLEFIWEE